MQKLTGLWTSKDVCIMLSKTCMKKQQEPKNNNNNKKRNQQTKATPLSTRKCQLFNTFALFCKH